MTLARDRTSSRAGCARDSTCCISLPRCREVQRLWRHCKARPAMKQPHSGHSIYPLSATPRSGRKAVSAGVAVTSSNSCTVFLPRLQLWWRTQVWRGAACAATGNHHPAPPLRELLRTRRTIPELSFLARRCRARGRSCSGDPRAGPPSDPSTSVTAGPRGLDTEMPTTTIVLSVAD